MNSFIVILIALSIPIIILLVIEGLSALSTKNWIKEHAQKGQKFYYIVNEGDPFKETYVKVLEVIDVKDGYIKYRSDGYENTISVVHAKDFSRLIPESEYKDYKEDLEKGLQVGLTRIASDSDITEKFTKEGVICSFCGTFNTHEQCGTYYVLSPVCYNCGKSTEV